MRKICGAVAFLLVSVILVTWIMFGPLVKGAMSAVWQSWGQEPVTNGGTQWTALFNLTRPGVDYIWQCDTTKRFHFDL